MEIRQQRQRDAKGEMDKAEKANISYLLLWKPPNLPLLRVKDHRVTGTFNPDVAQEMSTL